MFAVSIALVARFTPSVVANVPVAEGNVIVAEPLVNVPLALILIVSAPLFKILSPLTVCPYPKNCIGLSFSPLLFPEPAAYFTIATGISFAVNVETFTVELFLASSLIANVLFACTTITL